MSYTNGFQTLVQSMNGLLTFNDGAGTVIENGVITTQSLSMNNIFASLPTSLVTLWSNFTTGTANLLTNLTSGTINLGNSTVSLVVGSFTFLGTSIQSGTSGTFNFFTNVTGTSTVNFFSNMPSLGIVSIGNNANQNNIGNLRIVNNTITPKTSGQVIQIGTSNTNSITLGSGLVQAAYNTATTIASYLEIASGNPNCYLDFHCGGTGSNVDYDARIIATSANSTTSGTATMDIVASSIDLIGNTFVSNQTVGNAYPGYLNVNVATNTTDLNIVSANSVSPNAYDTQIRSYNGGIYGANGCGLSQTYNGQQEMFFNLNRVPRNLPTYNAGAMGYYSGAASAENAFTISGYAPYGGIQLGGCGSSNAKGFSTTWGASLVTYPGYGTRFKNGGVAFEKSSLSASDRGWVPTAGVRALQTLNINAGGNLQQAVSFGTTFSANPYVTATILIENINSYTDSLLITIYGVSTTGFNVNVKNTSGTNLGTNRWGYHWIAWGPY